MHTVTSVHEILKKFFSSPYALLALIILVILIVSEPIFSQKVLASSSITITTDKQSYIFGDTVVISGTVKTATQVNMVTIQILDPYSNLVQTGQANIAQDGTYTTSIEIAGTAWKSGGLYTIQVQYGSAAQAQTTFAYVATTAPTSGIFQVQIPNSQQTFGVPYTISGGSVSKIYANPLALSLTVSIQSNDYGTLTLLLPRSLLDAKNSDGSDDTFTILVDGTEIKPQKEQSTPSNRTLTIQFLQGDQEIQIIGTSMGLQNSSINPPNANLTGQQTSEQITTVGNQTFYFTALNDTLTSYHGVAAIPITFHNVTFTVFPSVFSAGPPGSCGDTNFGSEINFSDGTYEQLGVHIPGASCIANYTEIKLTNHKNPQAGIEDYHGKVMLLISTENQIIPEFPFAVPVLLISIVSLVIFRITGINSHHGH